MYSVTCLAFIIIIGAAVYEHVAIVPQWSAAPPLSLSMFQGQYGVKPDLFWKAIHPVTLLLFVFTLVAHWKSQRRKNLAIVLASYIGILAVTAVYFVPELIKITTTPFADSANADLVRRASLWETLSIVRLVVLIILSLVLLTGLTKVGDSMGRRTISANKRA